MAANLFAQFARPVKSVLEHTADLDRRDLMQLQIEGKRGENALTQLAREQSIAKQNALQQLFSNPAITTPGARETAMLGNPLLMQDGLSAQKARLDNDKTKAGIAETVAKTDASSFETRIKKANTAIADIAGLTSTQEAIASLEKHRASGDIDEQKYQQVLATIPQDPSQFQAWRRDMLMRTLDAKTQLEVEREQAKIAETGRHNKATETHQAGQLAVSRGQLSVAQGNLAETRRHHGATEKNQESTRDAGKIPPGYRKTADGNLEPVPGGPADLKIQGALNQDTQALTGSISGFDRLAVAANEVLKHPGLAGITGLRGAIPNIPGTDAANAEALLGTLKSQVGFGVLQDMRNNSKTGGALGSVSDAEGKRLEANLAALEKSQSLDQYKANLQKIIEYAEAAKDRVREAYNLKHKGAKTKADEPKVVDFSELK
jgi:hypothetical protein